MVEENATASENAEQTNSSNTLELNSYFGVKAGMTRIFNSDGNHIPVTVVKLISNIVTQVKTLENDGYEAYQVGYSEKREKLLIKPTKGHLKKSTTKNFTKFSELRTTGVDAANLGKEVTCDHFTPSMYIDVTGTSKGKGFQGVIKRWNFQCGPMAHGSKFHRTGGSIGCRATPGRVWKNKKMPGHMGCETKTVQNLTVVEVNKDKGYMLVRGSLPGAKNSIVKISKARKK